MKSVKGSTLVLWAVLLFLLAGAAMAQRNSRRSGNHGPKLVVLPVQVKCENAQIAQEAELLTFDYLKEMDFTIITGEKVKRAVKDCGFSLTDYSGGRERPRLGERDRDGNKKQVVTQTVLRKDALIEAGDYFRAPYALGAYYKIRPKTTKHLFGKRLNGRCELWVMIVDVQKEEVIYDGYSGEIGAAQDNDNAKIFSGLGALVASGTIGGGSRSKDLGWAMIATPFVARLDPGSAEDLMFKATSKAAQETFEDVWSRFLDWTKNR